MAEETLRVWLIPARTATMPQAVRLEKASHFETSNHFPESVSYPQEPERVYKKSFVLLQGGETGGVLAVYYLERL